MKSQRILVLLGHPDKETRTGSLADAYEAGAREAGHEVKRINVGDLAFDPILHKGYKVIQALEPDLVMAQEAIKWAEHVVLFYPNWFTTMPALLKGFFDRIWLPAFAYRFHKDKYMWDRLLKGRSGHVFICMDAWPPIERLYFGNFTNAIQKGVLRYAGFKPVRLTEIGPMKNVTEEKLTKWRAKMKKRGMRAN